MKKRLTVTQAIPRLCRRFAFFFTKHSTFSSPCLTIAPQNKRINVSSVPMSQQQQPIYEITPISNAEIDSSVRCINVTNVCIVNNKTTKEYHIAIWSKPMSHMFLLSPPTDKQASVQIFLNDKKRVFSAAYNFFSYRLDDWIYVDPAAVKPAITLPEQVLDVLGYDIEDAEQQSLVNYKICPIISFYVDFSNWDGESIVAEFVRGPYGSFVLYNPMKNTATPLVPPGSTTAENDTDITVHLRDAFPCCFVAREDMENKIENIPSYAVKRAVNDVGTSVVQFYGFTIIESKSELKPEPEPMVERPFMEFSRGTLGKIVDSANTFDNTWIFKVQYYCPYTTGWKFVKVYAAMEPKLGMRYANVRPLYHDQLPQLPLIVSNNGESVGIEFNSQRMDLGSYYLYLSTKGFPTVSTSRDHKAWYTMAVLRSNNDGEVVLRIGRPNCYGGDKTIYARRKWMPRTEIENVDSLCVFSDWLATPIHLDDMVDGKCEIQTNMRSEKYRLYLNEADFNSDTDYTN